MEISVDFLEEVKYQLGPLRDALEEGYPGPELKEANAPHSTGSDWEAGNGR